MKIWLTICCIMVAMVRSVVACEVALIIALDVSRSVDRDEYKLMCDGIGAAFLNDSIIEVISWLPGGVLVSVTQWGGIEQQRQAIGWRHLYDLESTLNFVEDLSATDRGYWMADTSVSGALLHADGIFELSPMDCRRRVVDVSGDGISNSGPVVRPISLAIGAKGVTVNGLVVAGASSDPVAYYKTEVITGPGAFVEVTDSYKDYEVAMARKLLRELLPSLSGSDNISHELKVSHWTNISADSRIVRSSHEWGVDFHTNRIR